MVTHTIPAVPAGPPDPNIPPPGAAAGTVPAAGTNSGATGVLASMLAPVAPARPAFAIPSADGQTTPTGESPAGGSSASFHDDGDGDSTKNTDSSGTAGKKGVVRAWLLAGATRWAKGGGAANKRMDVAKARAQSRQVKESRKVTVNPAGLFSSGASTGKGTSSQGAGGKGVSSKSGQGPAGKGSQHSNGSAHKGPAGKPGGGAGRGNGGTNRGAGSGGPGGRNNPAAKPQPSPPKPAPTPKTKQVKPPKPAPQPTPGPAPKPVPPAQGPKPVKPTNGSGKGNGGKPGAQGPAGPPGKPPPQPPAPKPVPQNVTPKPRGPQPQPLNPAPPANTVKPAQPTPPPTAPKPATPPAPKPVPRNTTGGTPPAPSGARTNTARPPTPIPPMLTKLKPAPQQPPKPVPKPVPSGNSGAPGAGGTGGSSPRNTTSPAPVNGSTVTVQLPKSPPPAKPTVPRPVHNRGAGAAAAAATPAGQGATTTPAGGTPAHGSGPTPPPVQKPPNAALGPKNTKRLPSLQAPAPNPQPTGKATRHPTPPTRGGPQKNLNKPATAPTGTTNTLNIRTRPQAPTHHKSLHKTSLTAITPRPPAQPVVPPKPRTPPLVPQPPPYPPTQPIPTRTSRETGYRDGARAAKTTAHVRAYVDGVKDGWTDTTQAANTDRARLSLVHAQRQQQRHKEHPVSTTQTSADYHQAQPIEVLGVDATHIYLGNGASVGRLSRGEVRTLKSFERRLEEKVGALTASADKTKVLKAHADQQAANATTLLEQARSVKGGEKLVGSLTRLAEAATVQAGKAEHLHQRALRAADACRAVLANVTTRYGGIYKAVVDSDVTAPAELAFYKD